MELLQKLDKKASDCRATIQATSGLLRDLGEICAEYARDGYLELERLLLEKSAIEFNRLFIRVIPNSKLRWPEVMFPLYKQLADSAHPAVRSFVESRGSVTFQSTIQGLWTDRCARWKCRHNKCRCRDPVYPFVRTDVDNVTYLENRGLVNSFRLD